MYTLVRVCTLITYTHTTKCLPHRMNDCAASPRLGTSSHWCNFSKHATQKTAATNLVKKLALLPEGVHSPGQVDITL